MERKKEEIPISITPEVNCGWIWINNNTLSCNINENDQLKRSTKYNIKVAPGIKAEDGATNEAIEHSFITQRLDASYVYIENWTSPGTPHARISFNQPVTQESVAAHIYMEPQTDDKKRYEFEMSFITE